MMKDAVKNLGYHYGEKEKTFLRACNLCGASSWNKISFSDRYGYEAPACSCLECGLTVLNPVMNTHAYADFYQNIYRPLLTAHFGRPYDPVSIQGMQREYAKERADFLAPYLTRMEEGTALLDIGGSTGIVSAVLREQFKVKPVVIDPAPLEVEVAASLGIKTVTGFVEDYEVRSGEEYGIVAIFQTLDHLLDCASTFKKIRSLLKDDGFLYVDIVDFRASMRRHGSVEGAIKIDHPYYFTEDTLELYLQKFGWVIIAKEYQRDKLHVGYLCKKGPTPVRCAPDSVRVRRFFDELRDIQNPVGRP